MEGFVSREPADAVPVPDRRELPPVEDAPMRTITLSIRLP